MNFAHHGLGVRICVLLGVGARSSPALVLGTGLSGGLVLLDLAAAAAPVGLSRLGFTSVGEVGSHGRRRVGARLHPGGGHSRRRRASEEGRNEERLDILFAWVGSVRTQPSGTNWALSWPT
jgi:hypothetical protein|uniref:Uncharacterized protein n=1 Tax=Zea mays TaxID=4577 RepID=A0A804PV13_MAIZE